MNFKNLPKEKRSQLILVLILTLGIIAGLGFGLIKGQYHELKVVGAYTDSNAQKLNQMQDSIKKAVNLDIDLTEAQKTLAEQESDLASGVCIGDILRPEQIISPM